MATQIERDFTVNLSADAVRDAMRDPKLIEKSEKSRDALEIEIRQVEETDARHVYEIDVVNYARSVKGIDKNKTEKSTTVVTWDLTARRRRWTWKGEHNSVHLEGDDEIVADGDRATLKMFATVDVKIPLVGRVVEKKIKDGFGDSWPAYVKLLEAHAKEQ